MGAHSKGLTPTIGQLWPHHRYMARLFADGCQPKEVCTITGFSPGQVTRILRSPLFQVEVERLMAQADSVAVDVVGDLKRMVGKALEVLDANLQANDVAREFKTKTAFGVLSEYGKHVVPQKHLHAHIHAHKKVQEMESGEVYEAIEDMLNEDEEEMEGEF